MLVAAAQVCLGDTNRRNLEWAWRPSRVALHRTDLVPTAPIN